MKLKDKINKIKDQHTKFPYQSFTADDVKGLLDHIQKLEDQIKVLELRIKNTHNYFPRIR